MSYFWARKLGPGGSLSSIPAWAIRRCGSGITEGGGSELKTASTVTTRPSTLRTSARQKSEKGVQLEDLSPGPAWRRPKMEEEVGRSSCGGAPRHENGRSDSRCALLPYSLTTRRFSCDRQNSWSDGTLKIPCLPGRTEGHRGVSRWTLLYIFRLHSPVRVI